MTNMKTSIGDGVNTDDVETFMDDYCLFSENRVYVLMALARKSENEALSHNNEIVFREVIKDKKDIRRKVSKLKAAAQGYTGDKVQNPTFRLYLSANARNTYTAFTQYQKQLIEWSNGLINGDDQQKGKLKRVDRHWMSLLQKPVTRDEVYFVFDIDEPDNDIEWFVDILQNHTEVIAIRESPHGYHVVTEKFNYNDLPEDFNKRVEDVKTDGMISLGYIGDTQ